MLTFPQEWSAQYGLALMLPAMIRSLVDEGVRITEQAFCLRHGRSLSTVIYIVVHGYATLAIGDRDGPIHIGVYGAGNLLFDRRLSPRRLAADGIAHSVLTGCGVGHCRLIGCIPGEIE